MIEMVTIYLLYFIALLGVPYLVTKQSNKAIRKDIKLAWLGVGIIWVLILVTVFFMHKIEFII